jgi:hypothetical protein
VVTALLLALTHVIMLAVVIARPGHHNAGFSCSRTCCPEPGSCH